MILNSNFANFVFQLPTYWFSPSVVKKYTPFLKRYPIPYTTLADYINSTVQSISWPAINQEEVTQMGAKEIRRYMTGTGAQIDIPKELKVTFKLTEGFINYLVFYDFYLEYKQHYSKTHEPYVPDFYLRVLDNYGYQTMSMHYKNVVYKGLSELDLSYTSNIPEFSAFTVDFVCNTINIKQEFD